jgi:hypothetical protein
MRRALLTLAAVVMAVSATAGPACACSCADLTAEEKADSADVVFTGRVRDIRRLAGHKRVQFRARVLYKGKVRRDVTISTELYGASCGFGFREGKRYTVFAYRDRGLATNICTGTRRGPIDPDRYGLPPGTRL